MTAVPESDILSDAELAVAAAEGDRTAFAGIYDRYADRLHDFCIGMVRDRNAAADCVQDTFCTAATRLDSLRDPDKLRPWLLSVAASILLVALLELGAACLTSLPGAATVPHSRLHHTWPKNTTREHREYMATNLDFPDPYIHQYNSQSWLAAYDVSTEKPQGTYRIFYVGDSFTEGTVPMHQSLSVLVGAELNKRA